MEKATARTMPHPSSRIKYGLQSEIEPFEGTEEFYFELLELLGFSPVIDQYALVFAWI